MDDHADYWDLYSWANEHGYSRYRCPICGRLFWTDGDPVGECCKEEEDDEE